MYPEVLASIVSGGAGLFGGFMSNMWNRASADDMINWQRQFAQKGIQWRVKDAEKAGIHPLYALGAQTHQFSPVSLDDRFGPAFAQAGQDIGRAIASRSEKLMRTLQENEMMARTSNTLKEGRVLDLQKSRLELENSALVQGQVQSMTSPHIDPGAPEAWYKRYKLGPGFEILAPKSQGEHPLETIESMSPIHRNAWIEYNSSVYGPGWKKMFYDWYWGGVPPGEHLKGDPR